MNETMSDSELAAAIKEATERTERLRQQQQALQQLKIKNAIADLQQQGKKRSEEEELDRLAAEELQRRALARQLKEQEEETEAAKERQKQANERIALEHKEAEARRVREAREEMLRKATEEAHAQERLTAQLEWELTHPKIQPIEPKPPTLADAGHPLAFLFNGSREKTEEIKPISSEEQSRNQWAKDRANDAYIASIRSQSTDRKNTVNGADYSSLREQWRNWFQGEMLSDSAAVHLLTLYYLHEIVAVMPTVLAQHQKQRMSMQMAAGMVETLLGGQ